MPIETEENRVINRLSTVSVHFASDLEKIKEAADYILSMLPSSLKEIKMAIICGSGLSTLASKMTGTVSIKYSSIPNFPESTVAGHGNKIVAGMLNGVPCLSLLGRFHYYEGYDMEQTVFPVRAMALMGIKTLLVTNAAGAIDPSFNIGDIMVIDDHISFPNMAGISPLRGPNIQELGVRFPSLTDAYDKRGYQLILQAAKAANVEEECIRTGVYVCQPGPAYETRAEVRFIRMIGGSAVGMSTVPEVVVAANAGMKVLGLSLITNKALDCSAINGLEPPTHAEVLAVASKRSAQLEELVYHLAPLI